MPATATKLSPAELTKLEHAFATDPASEAYRPLAEAYLGLGRYMEAMVVCKKGMKTHPNAADPRVLLARVYAEQGRDKKALEELQGALQVSPNDKAALRMTGQLQLKGGDAAGKAALLKAFELDPNDADTQAVMAELKVEAPKAAPPPPPPPVLTPAAPAAAQGAVPPALQDAPAGPVPAATSPNRPAAPSGARAAVKSATPAQPRQTVRRVQPTEESVSESSELGSGTYDVPSGQYGIPKKKSSALTRNLFFLLIFAVPVSLGAYYGIGQWRAKVAREVRKLLTETQDKLKADTYDSYQKASKLSEEALNLDPSSRLAASYAAYAYVIRWGEHGGDESTRQRATEYLADAKKSQEPLTYAIASEALLKLYGGKVSEARKELDGRVSDLEAKDQKSSLLYLTQGLVQMAGGDLERAKESLEKAQILASDDARVYVALGTLQRRRGNDGEALKHFNTALKYTRRGGGEKGHPEALLGTALIVLDQPDPGAGYVTAAQYLKSLLESEPPPSPRQLAMAHMVRAFLVSRVAHDLPLYTDKDFQKKLGDETQVTTDAGKTKAEIAKEEGLGMQDSQNPELLLVRAKRLLYEDNVNGAAEEVKKAIAMNGQRAHYHVELARVYLAKPGREKEAEDALRTALNLVPDSPKLITMLGQALYRQKKMDEAIGQFERAVKDPKSKNGEARMALARIYRDEKKDNAKSIENFERATQEAIGDTMTIATAFDEMAQLLEAKGDKQKARDSYEKSYNAEKEYDPALCHYARFLKKNADPKDADRIKLVAADYLKLAPKGECAAEMNALK
ncbi:MAG: tetratricopeptide repeat protein [Myxococcaceae bacterium]|nr:tetratricopeptide repeat protein [Myxococcaceae bacterium]